MWLNEYEQLMFSGENDNQNIAKAVQLKYNNMPDIFYKYRGIDEKVLEAFKNDTLYFSAVSNFNDPYECAMSLPYEQMQEQAYERWIEILKPCLIPGFHSERDDYASQDKLVRKIAQGFKIPKEDLYDIENMWKLTDNLLRGKIAEMKKETIQIGDEIYRVCSFSEINNSLLMWAHYSNNHQGFCLGYNFKEVHDDLTELMLPVIYNDDLLEITKHLFPNNGRTNYSLVMYAMTRKSTEWIYEREWRIITSAYNTEKSQPRKVQVPKSVFLGTRIIEKNKNKIIAIAKEKSMAVYQMIMKTDEFKLYNERIL